MTKQLRLLSKTAPAIGLMLLLSMIAVGQDLTNPLNIGLPPNGVFSGSQFDSVQLNNGNLHIEIPLWSVTGRGLSVAFKYVYDNKGWYFNETCDRFGYCTDRVTQEPFNNMQWKVAGPVDYIFGHTYPSTPCQGGGSQFAHSYTMQEPNGTKHSFQPNPEGQCWAPLGTPLYADDGSGWRLFVDTSSGNPLRAVSQNGTVVYGSVASVAIQDSNGNQITTAGPFSTFTDTTGRTFTGSGNSTYGLSYIDSSGNTQTIQVATQLVSIQTNQCSMSGGDICYEASGSWSMPHQITLPGNNLTYTINYPTTASYGEPTSITLPTGGQISYTWQHGDQGGRFIATRTETSGGQSYQWTYTPMNNSLAVWVNVTDPAGNATVPTCTRLSILATVCDITKMQYYQGSAVPANLRKTVVTDYALASGQSIFYLPIRDTTTWNQQNLVTKTETDWDTVNTTYGISHQPMAIFVRNPIESREYAYGSGAAGALVRRTHYAYLHNSNSAYATLNILDSVTSQVVYDGSSNIKAQTTYTYDGSTTTSTSGTPAPNHDYTNFGSGFNTRGNLTQTSRGLLVSGSWTWLNIINTFDDLGNVLSSKDPGLHTTTFSYADNWADSHCTLGANTFAYLTTTTDALSHQTKHSYYRCTGLVASTKDQNDINAARAGTTVTYDFLNRPLIVNYPDGGQTTNSYVDSTPLSVTAAKLVTTGLNIQNTMVFDGLGRPQQSQMHSPNCGGGTGLVKVDHAYGFGSSGRLSQVSTPYCNTPDTTYGLMTTTNHDALDRVTSVVETDGSTISTTYSGTAAGLTATVTDEAGKGRKTQTDALGRLTAVWEDPSSLNYETDYAYNTLNDLTSVTQKAGAASGSWRTRTFTYDSLSRLKCAANPEVTSGLNVQATCPATDTGTYTAGTIGYNYDNDGNVLTETAPAPNQTGTALTVATNYSYDAVHRPTQKSYTGTPATPTAKYGYDGSALSGCGTTPPPISPSDANPVNYRTSMCDGSGATSWSHDPRGRVLTQQEIINGASAINKAVKYAYYKDGELNTLTYPGGRVVTYTANSGSGYSAGLPVSAVDTGNGINYVTNAVYTPPGSIASFKLGASINGAFAYNTRLQPMQMFYGTNTAPALTGITCPATVGNIMHRTYDFHLGTDNGNVGVIANCRDTNRTQNFTYDNLNRITQAYTSGVNWGETFTIDGWGNLTNKGPVAGKTNYENFNAAPASIRNQLNGFCHDSAGNLVLNSACPTGTFTPTYSYDIENRLVGTAGFTYVYDGDGTRVKKCSNAGCTTGTLYWVGTGSDALQESDFAGNATEDYIFFNGKRVARRDVSGGVVHYYVADHLGSTDVVTGSAGAIQKETDYYPYGGEIVIAGSDINNYKFTGKERDSESGLDEFGARYYGSSLGRFMTPDWATKPISVPYADFGDPQTLNLYGYVRNNPLSKADADGHCYPWCTVIGGAIIGGVIGGGGEIIAAKLHGQSVDWKKVEGSALKGAVTGAAIGLAGPEAGVAATAALGAGGNVVGGVADRTLQGQSAKEVLSPTEVAKDAASGAIGGAIGGAKVGETAGEFIANGSAKVAAASGDQAAANFYTNNASAIGTGVAKAIDVTQSTGESYHDQSNQQQQQQQQQQRTQCSDRSSCHQ